MPHPNYVGVIGEFVGVALLMHARVTGPLAVLAFGLLILRRLEVEHQRDPRADARRRVARVSYWRASDPSAARA